MSFKSAFRWDGLPCFAVLSLCAVGTTLAWHRGRVELLPPYIPGYSWAQHPDALLVTYPLDDCGCSRVEDVVRVATEEGIHVVVASEKQQDGLKAIQKPVKQGVLQVIANADPMIIKRFSPRHKLGLVRIVQGQVVGTAEGGMPDVSFFKKRL